MRHFTCGGARLRIRREGPAGQEPHTPGRRPEGRAARGRSVPLLPLEESSRSHRELREPRRRRVVNQDEPVRVRVVQRPKHDGVQDAEDGRGGANADRERQDGDCGIRRVLAQDPQCDAKVGPRSLDAAARSGVYRDPPCHVSIANSSVGGRLRSCRSRHRLFDEAKVCAGAKLLFSLRIQRHHD